MPIQSCKCPEGRTGFRWGDTGTCYCRVDPAEAKRLAQRQARAILARRSDAKPRAWAISEKQAPSPRAMIQALRPMADRFEAAVGPVLDRALDRWLRERAPLYPRADAEDFEITDAMAGDLRVYLQAALSGVDLSGVRPNRGAVDRAARQTANQAARAERQALHRQGANPDAMAVRLGVPRDKLFAADITLGDVTEDALRAWASEGLGYIVAFPQQRAQQLQRYIATQVHEGARVETIRKRVQAHFGTDRRHAELIARDQVGKLNGQITRATQTSLGVDEYVWRTASDGRVRDEHFERDGDTFRWDNPPDDGHPGEPIQCRCRAVAVLPQDLRSA